MHFVPDIMTSIALTVLWEAGYSAYKRLKQFRKPVVFPSDFAEYQAEPETNTQIREHSSVFKTCNFCNRIVVKYDVLSDSQIKCLTCKNFGR